MSLSVDPAPSPFPAASQGQLKSQPASTPKPSPKPTRPQRDQPRSGTESPLSSAPYSPVDPRVKPAPKCVYNWETRPATRSTALSITERPHVEADVQDGQKCELSEVVPGLIYSPELAVWRVEAVVDAITFNEITVAEARNFQ
ncbi:hypothetical protein GQ43DRAFT_429705 [Delitschia confertaspora ATCC 74209]|uniref:Uncharacterized protein n=1 Tax=Delitschia confertaspora ATCC 74209 TaxID=1513339 RepID=A0A9P4JUS1_9PLEO|nr:hypothetical protein GQ43DRAFT_429705 [Delitschia confertaspora ATCC 74209]